MPCMRPKGTAAELEVRRRLGVSLLQQGHGVRAVARMVGVRHSSVTRWKKAYQQGGAAALRAKPHPGPRPKLSPQQRKRLLQLLSQGPRAHGYSTELWTLRRVAQLIEQRFGVQYHPCYVWYILRQLGWTAQKPERRARERDESAVAQWRQEQWPQIKKRSPERA